MKQIFDVNINQIRLMKIPALLELSKKINNHIMFHPLLGKIVTFIDSYLILKKHDAILDNSAELEDLTKLAFYNIPSGYSSNIDIFTTLENINNLSKQLITDYNKFSIGDLLLFFPSEISIVKQKELAEANLKYFYRSVTKQNINCAYSTLIEIRCLVSTPNDVCMQIALYIQILASIKPFIGDSAVKSFFLQTLEYLESGLVYLQQLPEYIPMDLPTNTFICEYTDILRFLPNNNNHISLEEKAQAPSDNFKKLNMR